MFKKMAHLVHWYPNNNIPMRRSRLYIYMYIYSSEDAASSRSIKYSQFTLSI